MCSKSAENVFWSLKYLVLEISRSPYPTADYYKRRLIAIAISAHALWSSATIHRKCENEKVKLHASPNSATANINATCYSLHKRWWRRDIALLSASCYGLQKLVNICKMCGDEFMLNSQKSQLIIFGGKNPGQCSITLNSTEIPWANKVKYLAAWASIILRQMTHIPLTSPFLPPLPSLSLPFLGCLTLLEILEIMKIYWNNFFLLEILEIY